MSRSYLPAPFRTPGATASWIASSFALLALVLFSLPARAATITVCASGCDHATLDAAVAAAAAGDVLAIGAGEYVGGVTIAKDLTLRGESAERVTIAGGGRIGPVLFVHNAAAGPLDRNFKVQIEGLTLTGGSGYRIDVDRYGAGMYIKGADVTLDNVTVNANVSQFDGGGIYNDAGKLTVRNSRITNNRASNSGGGIYNDADGTLNLIDSLVAGNVAMNPPDLPEEDQTFATGGGIVTRDTATIEGSTIENNRTGTWGGGIYCFGMGRLTVRDTSVISNTSHGEGGGLYNSARVTLEGLVFERNLADKNGGGVFNMGNLTVDTLAASGNRALNGGGIAVQKGFAPAQVGEMVMTRATLSDNTAVEAGGGIFAENEADVEITLCTISGNTAQDGGGARADAADKLELTECTVAANRATGFDEESGAGLSANEGNILRLAGTIVANDAGRDCYGSIRSDGHNLDEDATCAFERNSDVSAGNAGLRDLDDNGGPLRTHALISSSDAIDAGHPNRCQPTDQRGAVRPQDGDEDGSAVCDIGAVEREGPGTIPGTPTPDGVPTTPTPDGAPTTPTPTATEGTPNGPEIFLPRVLREG